ncbi:MAG: TolC family protein, partial [Planctomycetaceae bacterium]|nr:TolC family protein [Planctomycetaceae bacterium]
MHSQRVIAKVLACSVLLLLSGCQIPNIFCADEEAPLPEDFNGKTSTKNSADIGIDEFFNDPVLTHLIGSGLASNQELKIRNQEIQIANNEILSRRGAYLPFVSVGLGGGIDKTSRFTPLGAAEDQLTYPGSGGANFPDPIPNVRLSADLLWRIDIWRELRNARDAAMQRSIEAVEARDYFVTRLVAEIAENYYELAALDKRLEFLNQTIELQQQSLEVAKAQKAAARGTELGVQRFLAEVRKNESQRLIVSQRIIEVENRINFLVGRYPQAVDRVSWDFIKLDSRALSVGVPAELLQNRSDIRAAEREVAASGLDVLVARARFYPQLDITASVGYEAFNPRYLFDPGAFIAGAAGGLVAPLINKKAIQADYLNANARQIQAIYNYQRTVLNAFTEVANRVSKVEKYRMSVEIKQGQVKALEESVDVASQLFQNARAEYIDVLFSQRDLLEARTNLIETKQQQLSAIVNAYQALGGGYLMSNSVEGYNEFYSPPAEMNPGDVELPPIPD